MRRSVDTSYIAEKTTDVWPSPWFHMSWQWPVSLSHLHHLQPSGKRDPTSVSLRHDRFEVRQSVPWQTRSQAHESRRSQTAVGTNMKRAMPRPYFPYPSSELLINSLKYSCSQWLKVVQSRLYFTFMSERERYFDSFVPAVFCILLGISSNVLKLIILRHWKHSLPESQCLVLKNLCPKFRSQGSWFYSIYSLMYIPFSLFWKHDIVCTCSISFLLTWRIYPFLTPSKMDKVQNHPGNFITTNKE